MHAGARSDLLDRAPVKIAIAGDQVPPEVDRNGGQRRLRPRSDGGRRRGLRGVGRRDQQLHNDAIPKVDLVRNSIERAADGKTQTRRKGKSYGSQTLDVSEIG